MPACAKGLSKVCLTLAAPFSSPLLQKAAAHPHHVLTGGRIKLASFRPHLDSDSAVTLCCIPADDNILIYPKLLNLDTDLFYLKIDSVRETFAIASADIYVTSAKPSLLVQARISSAAEIKECHGCSSQVLDMEGSR